MESSIPKFQREARLAFYEAGTTLTSWSRKRGYRPGTVCELIRYAARNPGYIPRGRKTMAIARDLERDIGLVIVVAAAGAAI